MLWIIRIGSEFVTMLQGIKAETSIKMIKKTASTLANVSMLDQNKNRIFSQTVSSSLQKGLPQHAILYKIETPSRGIKLSFGAALQFRQTCR